MEQIQEDLNLSEEQEENEQNQREIQPGGETSMEDTSMDFDDEMQNDEQGEEETETSVDDVDMETSTDGDGLLDSSITDKENENEEVKADADNLNVSKVPIEENELSNDHNAVDAHNTVDAHNAVDAGKDENPVVDTPLETLATPIEMEPIHSEEPSDMDSEKIIEAESNGQPAFVQDKEADLKLDVKFSPTQGEGMAPVMELNKPMSKLSEDSCMYEDKPIPLKEDLFPLLSPKVEKQVEEIPQPKSTPLTEAIPTVIKVENVQPQTQITNQPKLQVPNQPQTQELMGMIPSDPLQGLSFKDLPMTDDLATLALAALTCESSEIKQEESPKIEELPKIEVPPKNEEPPKKDEPVWCDVGIIKANSFHVTSFFQPGLNHDPEHLKLTADKLPNFANLASLNLEPGTAYKFRVCAVNSCGKGPWSEVSAFKTCLPGYPGAPSSIKISKSNEGAHLSWEPPSNPAGTIIEYSVCLAVKNTQTHPQGDPKGQLAFIRVYSGPNNQTVVPNASLSSAHIDTTSKPAIIFRIAAKNEKGFGPATQVRWLQDVMTSPSSKNIIKKPEPITRITATKRKYDDMKY